MAKFLNTTWPSNLSFYFNSYCHDCNHFTPHIEELEMESFSCEASTLYHLSCEHSSCCEYSFDRGWEERGRIEQLAVKTEEEKE